MAINVSRYFKPGADEITPGKHAWYFNLDRRDREHVVVKIQHDLASFAVSRGYSQNQTAAALDTLFNTFATEWVLFLLVGSTVIKNAIADDVTIPWLDTNIGGKTLRERLIDRL